jgi:hypothetical protein
MIIKVKIGHWRFTFTFFMATRTRGVNSTLPDGKHILMWDFDDVQICNVRGALTYIQILYHLPRIYILQSGNKDHYLAYCFKRFAWERAIAIVALTPHVDYNFFRFGVLRKHWTLRIDKKEGRKPKLLYVIPSKVPEDAYIDEMESFVEYETMTDNSPRKVIRLERRQNT